MEVKNKLEKQLLLFQLVTLFVLFLILNLISEGSYGGADDLGHFRFAKYALKYPGLILDQWAKPLFTFFASPFAQLGYWGVRLFNVITGIITAFFIYKIANLLKIKNSWTLPTILFFVPVYASMLLSGMTEILFGLVLVLAIFLVLKEKYIWSAVVVSFLHMARTEGVVLWPIFIVIYIWRKQWKAIPFLITGSLVYTLLGGFYFNDFLCLFTKMPYTGTYDIYGHGELLHFVKATKLIFGFPLTIFFIIGSGYVFLDYIKTWKKETLFEMIIIISPILVFYAAHSYVWWKGINSLGLIRVMACISPLFAIYSLKGINLFLEAFKSNKFNKIRLSTLNYLNLNRFNLKRAAMIGNMMIILLIAYIIISTPFKVMEIPVPLPAKESYVKKAASWFSNSEFKNRKIYIWEPYFWFFAGMESYNTPKMVDGIPNRQNPEIDVKPGEIVIWDAHFSAVDGRFPFEKIAANPYYKLVNAVIPKREILVFGHPYFMAFFERLDSPGNYNNYAILDSFKVAATPKYTVEILKTNPANQSISGIDGANGHLRNKGIKITSQKEFYDLIKCEAKKVQISEGAVLKINFNLKGGSMIMVVSLKQKQNLYFYRPTELKSKEDWEPKEIKVHLPLPKKSDDIFNVYFWNKDGSEAEIDDVKIEIHRECY